MDELFEALTLIQIGKIRDFPIVLFGSDYWGGLLDWVRSAMISEGKASEADLGLLSLTDSPAEARDLILAATKDHYEGAGYERRAREATRKVLGLAQDRPKPEH
jgi:predicted Rossmann-fold nucleotide-binding protein